MRTPEATALATSIKAIVADIYQIKNVGETFNIDPRIAQTVEEKTQQENEFLQKINVLAVREIAGDVLGFGVPKRLRKRTSSAPNRATHAYGKRRPTDPTALIQRQYACEDYESDALIDWAKLDSWVHLPDFYGRYRTNIMQARANDKLAVGWNGQFSAANTDPDAFMDLQDNQAGWLQYLIENAPEQVLGITPDAAADFGYTVDKIRVGEGGDYDSLDQMVFHMRQSMIHKTLRKRRGIRAILGDELVLDENSKLFGANNEPTERIARNLYLNDQTFGRTEIESSDEFPQRGIVLSELNNISVYYQATAMRRKIEDDHNEKGIVDYEYGREDHVFEVAEGVAAVHPDSIQLKDKHGNWVDIGEVKDSGGVVTTAAADPWKVAEPA